MQKEATDLGADFSLATLLAPLPASSAGVCFDVLMHIDANLAPVVLADVCKAQGLGQFDSTVFENVIWKLTNYLPSMCQLHYGPGNLSARIKDLQSLSPDSTLVRIPARDGRCPACADIDLCPRRGVDRCRRRKNLPLLKATMPEEEGAMEVRYKFYSWSAGVQYASFEESRCPKCERFFLGSWSYKKNFIN